MAPDVRGRVARRYTTPEAALRDLVAGVAARPSSGIDPAALGLPEHLIDWTFEPGQG